MLRQVILHDLPELTEVAERIVSKDLEPILEESSRDFAVQQAEAAWRRRALKDKNADETFKSQEVQYNGFGAVGSRQLQPGFLIFFLLIII